jgi:hypothetical protein
VSRDAPDARLNGLGDGIGILNIEAGHEHARELVELSFLLGFAHGGDDIPALGLEMAGGGFADTA